MVTHRCRNCGEEGHNVRTCPDPCGRCYDNNHEQRNCPFLRRARSVAAPRTGDKGGGGPARVGTSTIAPGTASSGPPLHWAAAAERSAGEAEDGESADGESLSRADGTHQESKGESSETRELGAGHQGESGDGDTTRERESDEQRTWHAEASNADQSSATSRSSRRLRPLERAMVFIAKCFICYIHSSKELPELERQSAQGLATTFQGEKESANALLQLLQKCNAYCIVRDHGVQPIKTLARIFARIRRGLPRVWLGALNVGNVPTYSMEERCKKDDWQKAAQGLRGEKMIVSEATGAKDGAEKFLDGLSQQLNCGLRYCLEQERSGEWFSGSAWNVFLERNIELNEERTTHGITTLDEKQLAYRFSDADKKARNVNSHQAVCLPGRRANEEEIVPKLQGAQELLHYPAYSQNEAYTLRQQVLDIFRTNRVFVLFFRREAPDGFKRHFMFAGGHMPHKQCDSKPIELLLKGLYLFACQLDREFVWAADNNKKPADVLPDGPDGPMSDRYLILVKNVSLDPPDNQKKGQIDFIVVANTIVPKDAAHSAQEGAHRLENCLEGLQEVLITDRNHRAIIAQV